jgi:hypothetical protein
MLMIELACNQTGVVERAYAYHCIQAFGHQVYSLVAQAHVDIERGISCKQAVQHRDNPAGSVTSQYTKGTRACW